MSAYLYAVRCNFTVPAREAAWNAWYGGPKMRTMLALPQFLAMQRFAASALDRRRKYLALWRVASPEAFTTPEYRAQWGFAEWTADIADWSRDLFRAPELSDGLTAAGAGEALHLVAFDGLGAAETADNAARMKGRYPDMAWLESIGLDRHSPLLGLRKVASAWRPSDFLPGESLFEPIMPPASAIP